MYCHNINFCINSFFNQAIIFRASSAPHSCVAHFPPGWGVRAYVLAFSVTNFFIPLLFLSFCYGAICLAIWDNFNRYLNKLKSLGETKCDFVKNAWKNARSKCVLRSSEDMTRYPNKKP